MRLNDEGQGSHLHCRVAFGDSEGNIALFDLITGRCLLFRSLLDDAAPSSVENSSDSIEEAMTERRVMWMMFDSEAITKATVLVSTLSAEVYSKKH